VLPQDPVEQPARVRPLVLRHRAAGSSGPTLRGLTVALSAGPLTRSTGDLIAAESWLRCSRCDPASGPASAALANASIRFPIQPDAVDDRGEFPEREQPPGQPCGAPRGPRAQARSPLLRASPGSTACLSTFAAGVRTTASLGPIATVSRGVIPSHPGGIARSRRMREPVPDAGDLDKHRPAHTVTIRPGGS
jgi:hypothetical protein